MPDAPHLGPKTQGLPLHQLSAALQAVLEEQFGGTHLLTAEIASLSDQNARGHCYLELIDKNPATGEECRMRATIWANRYRVIAHYFLQEAGQRLAKGLQILFEAELAFHPTYGLSLNILEIDAGFTLGRQQQALEQIMARLAKEGLLEKQKQLTPAPVLQRLAVISSPSAAGYQDFVHQLEANTYGYDFSLTLFTAIMQGADTEESVLRALAAISRQKDGFDAVVIIRGGGADQDLVGFNTYALGKALAEFPLPILTGIGHERDYTVPDRVAYQRLKTPTAVAEFLIERAALFEAEVDELVQALEDQARTALLTQQNQISRLENGLIGSAAAFLPSQWGQLATLTERLQGLAQKNLATQTSGLELLAKQVQLLDPRLQLKRGFALIYANGKRVQNKKDLKGPLQIVVQDGEAHGTFTPQ
jgi:exodeoxyribonuclease VII large subunit